MSFNHVLLVPLYVNSYKFGLCLSETHRITKGNLGFDVRNGSHVLHHHHGLSVSKLKWMMSKTQSV